MHTIAMDPYSFDSGGGVAVEGALTRQIRRSARVRATATLATNGFEPAVVRQTTVKTPARARLANVHSPRDN